MSRYHYFLFSVFFLIVVWSGFRPVFGEEWWLESALVIVGMLALIFAGWYRHLSKFSCTLIVAYMCLPIIGAHYSFMVPIGKTLADFLHSNRNMYDRIVHFCSGFLLFYPLREVLIQKAKIKGVWTYIFPLAILGALSAVWEVLEWVTVLHVNSSAGTAFLGIQDDIWDTQKDMFVAFVGTFLAIGITYLVMRAKKKRMTR